MCVHVPVVGHHPLCSYPSYHRLPSLQAAEEASAQLLEESASALLVSDHHFRVAADQMRNAALGQGRADVFAVHACHQPERQSFS